MNDPAYIEAAQALARRMIGDGGKSDEERAAYGLRLCVARTPEKGEVAKLVALYREQLAHFQNDSDAARKLVGEKRSAEEAAPTRGVDGGRERAVESGRSDYEGVSYVA